MRSSLFVVALSAAACAGAPPPKAHPIATTAPPPACPPCATPSAPTAVSVDPDPPHPEDLEEVKAMLTRPPPLVETAPRISPDGKHVAFVSTASGRPALYVKELGSSEAPRKVGGVLPPRFRRPVFSSDGASLYFTADDHGDEAFAIFRLALATGAIEPVTPGERLHRDGPWFTKNGDRMFFTGRAMAERGTVLFEQKTAAGAAPARVFASEAVSFAALRPDGAQILVVEAAKANELFVVDLPAHGPPRHLYPDAGKNVTIHDVAYSPDGARAFVATDDGGEKATILAIDVKSGRIVRRFVEARYAASKAQELQAFGERVGFVVDAGIRHDVRVLDAVTLAPIPTPGELPIGSEVPGAMHPNMTGGLDLAADGKHAVIQWSTPTSSPRVHVIDTKTGARSLLTDAPIAEGPAIETTITAIPSFDGLGLPTLVYLPANAAGKRLPVVVLIHGGFPFASTARFDPKVRLFTAAGYAVVEPNVRGSGGFGRAYELADDGVKKLEAVRDLGAIARWVGAQPWADPKRLAIGGGSVGGYYTLLGLEHDPEVWRCGLALVPMYDVEDNVRNTDGDLRDFWEKKELAPLSEPMLLAALSPSTYVDRIKAPLFVFAAARDARATIGQNEALVRTMRARGATFEYMRSEAGHSIDEPKTRAELFARMLRFLRTHLRE
jgi:dipeptidyl aminopeptidase/acylaminoacyl peptidase